MADSGAGSAVKASISKEDLRRMMKERATKKIDSPFAKYDGSGQLLCVLCKFHVKSEASWTAHVNGRQHQQAIAAAKPNPSGKSASRNTADASLFKTPGGVSDKRPTEAALDSSLKKLKVSSKGEERLQTRAELTASQIPADFFDSSEVKTPTPPAPPAPPVPPTSLLPDNFFDKPTKNMKQKLEREKKLQEEEEWQKFEKDINEETHKSAVAVEIDDDEAKRQRELEEIEEQLVRWEKVHDLELKKEAVAKKSAAEEAAKKETPTETADSDSDSDHDGDDFNMMDWRRRKLF